MIVVRGCCGQAERSTSNGLQAEEVPWFETEKHKWHGEVFYSLDQLIGPASHFFDKSYALGALIEAEGQHWEPACVIPHMDHDRSRNGCTVGEAAQPSVSCYVGQVAAQG